MPTTQRHDLNITHLSTEQLRPYPGNARHHSKQQIRKLGRQIQKVGWINPIIADETGMILAGHGRFQAAQQIGLSIVPVIQIPGLSKAEKRSYILSDNRLGDESTFSKKQLRVELQELYELGGDLELTGFNAFEIDSLMAIEPDEPKDEEVVELPAENAQPVARLSDCWHVASCRIVCGDARDPAAYDLLLKGERATVVLTDPPYGCKISGFVSGLGKTKHTDFVAGAGEESLAEFGRNLLRPAFRQIAANVLPGAIGYVFSDWRAAPYLHDAAQGVFAEQKNLAVWAKTSFSMGAFYRSQHELVHIYKLTPGKHINNIGMTQPRSNLWVYPGANVFRKGRMADLEDHATVKNRKMCEDAIVDTSRRGDLVLDCFAGSGTTLSAAHVVGRRGYGIELDPRFVDVILRRLSAVTGETPLLNGETPLDEVARARAAEREGGMS